jgi:hypothetical protein
MKRPGHDDDLNELFSRMRDAPATADPARVAHGFETRVLARLRPASTPDALRWFWRWSAVFGVTAAICVVLAIQNYNALADDSLVALDGGVTLLGWFY